MPDAQRSLQDVLKENEYLRAEVAYLKKLRALRQEKEQAAQKKRG
jgi:transposase